MQKTRELSLTEFNLIINWDTDIVDDVKLDTPQP